MSSFILNSTTLDLNNNDCSQIMNNTTDINFNNQTNHMNYKNKSNRRIMKKPNYRRYRSGSSSDSAITFENAFEEDDDFAVTESNDLFDDFNSITFNFACLALQQKTILNSSIIKRTIDIMKRYYNSSELESCVDKFGFALTDEQLQKSEDKTHFYFEYLISQLLNAHSSKYWSVGCESIKCLVREYGIPNEFRAQLWLTFIKAKIDESINIDQVLSQVKEYETQTYNSQIDVLRQIDLDITRTFPNHKMFFTDADGISKLRRILIGYCVCMNSTVGYCQGMNFIAALLLIVFDGNEKHSLMGLICIIDHYFPPHYYDHHLTGARADQMLLKDLVTSITSNTKSMIFTDLMLEDITSALSLNWFLSLFHSSLPWQVRLFVIDCFWLEGVKVLFRFSLALIKMGLNCYPIESNSSSGELINTIRETAKNCYDAFELRRIAFHEIKLPKRKYMATRRSFYVKQITSQIQKSIQPNTKETTTQWIRRRSSEILGLKVNNHIDECRIVISLDQTKVAVFSRSDRGKNEINILYVEDCQKSHITRWTFKNTFIIGVSNDGNRIICCHSSNKFSSKAKEGIKVDLIGVDFDACDGFYLEDCNLVIIIGSSGVVSKHAMNRKEVENTMLLNDKLSKVVSAELDRKSKLIWLNTISNNNYTHKFISLDINTLDIYTTINTDCFSIHQFFIFNNYINSLILVKSDPINGKLMKVIDILTQNTHKERLYDLSEEVFDIRCFSMTDFNDSVFVSHSSEHKSLNSCLKDKSLENLIILITKNTSNIAIEYKYENCWKKTTILTDLVKDISEINAIKIVKLMKDKNEFNITLVVYTSVSSLINVKFQLKSDCIQQ